MHRTFSFFLFFRRCCLSSSSAFPAVFSGLCSLFSFPVRSLGRSLLSFHLFVSFFSVLSDVSSATVLRLPSFPWGFSSPPRVPHFFFGLRFIFLYCLCFSPVLVISPPPPAFASDVLGFISVLGVASAPAVLAVAPPFFHPFVSATRFPHAAVQAAPCGLSLCFSACCGYDWFLRSSSAFSACYGFPFLSYLVFPPAAALAAPSGLRPHFSHAATPAAPFAFGVAPAVFLAEGSPVAVPQGLVAAFHCIYAHFLLSGFCRMLSYIIGLLSQAAFSPLVSPPPRACLRCSSLQLRFLLSWSALLCFV